MRWKEFELFLFICLFVFRLVNRSASLFAQRTWCWLKIALHKLAWPLNCWSLPHPMMMSYTRCDTAARMGCFLQVDGFVCCSVTCYTMVFTGKSNAGGGHSGHHACANTWLIIIYRHKIQGRKCKKKKLKLINFFNVFVLWSFYSFCIFFSFSSSPQGRRHWLG